jgi:hypothetical protein
MATNNLPVRQAFLRDLAVTVMTPAGYRARRIGQRDKVAPGIIFISGGGTVRTGLFEQPGGLRIVPPVLFRAVFVANRDAPAALNASFLDLCSSSYSLSRRTIFRRRAPAV